MRTHDASSLPPQQTLQRPIPALCQQPARIERQPLRLRSRSCSRQCQCQHQRQRQRGVATVEFALIALLFFSLLFAILELGRMMYLYNTMQEVTRRGAREAVVRWVDQSDAVKTIALFGAKSLPAAPEITADNISIGYLNKAGNEASPLPLDAGDNIAACSDATRSSSCIVSVRVALDDVRYSPMVSLFGLLDIGLPASAVVMPAESLGLHGQ